MRQEAVLDEVRSPAKPAIEPKTRARRTAQRRQRVLILSADLGEGHAAAARALAGELRASPLAPEVTVVDGLDALGPLLRTLIRDSALAQYRSVPRAFWVIHRLIMRRTVRRCAHAGLRAIGARNLERLVKAHRPDVIVSTYSGVNPVLAQLRRRGRVHARLCTTVLDVGSLGFWVNPGLDLHLVMHPQTREAVEARAGDAAVELVRPLVAPAIYEGTCRSAARDAFDWPDTSPVILVSGGGWGIGDLDGAVDAALELPEAQVICVAGRNEPARERLTRRFADSQRVRVLGFSDRMPELLAACDVVVHSGGGMTCMEALVAGRPSVVYQPPPGHWRVNAAEMRRLGIARLADTPQELIGELRDALAAPKPPASWTASSAADAILALDAA